MSLALMRSDGARNSGSLNRPWGGPVMTGAVAHAARRSTATSSAGSALFIASSTEKDSMPSRACVVVIRIRGEGGERRPGDTDDAPVGQYHCPERLVEVDRFR